MPTRRGLAIAVLLIGMLAVGLVRDELGVVVWSGGLLLVELVVIVVAAAAGVRLRAVRARFAAELEHPVVEAGDAVGVRASVPALPLVPGLYLEHALHLAWADHRTHSVSAVVAPGGRRSWTFRAPARGDYRCPASRLLLRDVFGFTATAVTDARPLRMLVLPADPDLEPDLPSTRGGEHAAERSPHRVRSDELREVRPYVPGDDVRRLSWKHLATYRELLIRIGEAIPPSRGVVRCRIDEAVPHGVAPLAAGDALMRALRAVVRTADERGLELVCRLPGTGELALTLDSMGAASSEAVDERAAAAVAGFVPGERPAAPPPRRESPSSWFTITAGDAAGGAHLSVAPLLEPEPPAAPVWKRLVLREAT